jgi:ABC-type multidrug transport system fused ATPase/permease subunit
LTKLAGFRTTWVRLKKILNPQHQTKYLWMVFLSFLGAILEVIGISVLLHVILSILKPEFIPHNIFTRWLSNTLGVTEQIDFVLIISILLLLVYILKNILIVQLNKIQVRYAFEVTSELSSRRYKAVSENDIPYFSNRSTADVLNELFGALLFLPETIILPSILMLSELMVVVVLLGAVLFYNPMLFLFIFFTAIPAGALLVYINRKRLAGLGERIHNVSPRLFQNVNQLTKGVADFKLWNVTEKYQSNFESYRNEFFRLRKSLYIQSTFVPIRIYEVIAILGILCVVLYVIQSQEYSGELISYISLYAGISFRLLPSINRIIGSFNQLATHEHKLDYFTEETELKTAVYTERQQQKVTYQSQIELEGVRFGYEESNPVYEDLTFRLKKGEFVGLIGKSGSGKTTFINLLTTLISPQEGRLTLDGQQIDENNKKSYRFLFSLVRQDVFLLNDTILSNIVFMHEQGYEEEKLAKILQEVNLKKWVDTLPQGIHTPVGDLGNRISGGQKQRIALARALYKDAEVFIFDEATNNLDKESSELILDAIATLKQKGKTAVFITHKLDELKLCDKIYVVEGKKLNEAKAI